MKVSELAKKLKLTRQTIWRYMNDGKLRYHQDFKRSHRYFKWDEVLEDLGLQQKQEEKLVIGYCRVSTIDQKQDLIYQKQLIENYCTSKGYQFKIIEDIGSGINYNKKGLNELIKLISNKEIHTLVLVYKDRLLRFGNEIIFEFCKNNNIKIEIINQSEDMSKEKELVESVLQIITVFASKIYGSRSHKTKNILKSNKDLWTNDVQL